MLFLSPSVNANESDMLTSAQENTNNVAAIAGAYQWGPADKPTLITTGEDEFIAKFGIPNVSTAKYVMPLLDFFGYANAAYVVRQVGPTARNAFPAAETPKLIKNEDAAQVATNTGIDFYARYPGSAGNGLTIAICDSTHFATWELASEFIYAPMAGEFAVAVLDTKGFWTGVAATKQVERLVVSGTATGTSITIFGAAVAVAAGDTAAQVAAKIAADTDFTALFDSVSVQGTVVTYIEKTNGRKVGRVAPASAVGLEFNTSVYTYGVAGGVLERYELLQNTPTATAGDGTPKFWFDVINNSSKYVYAGDRTVNLSNRVTELIGGVDDYSINITAGVALLKNTEAYKLQFIIAPDVSAAEQKACVDIAVTRGDCTPLIAPPMTAVVNNSDNEVESIKEWRNLIGVDSDYGFAVDNWGYIYDKYNQIYRWVPATGGTAGLMAKTFADNDPWISPAGLTRGKYRNYSKMAWSASKEARDQLYPMGINSIVTFPEEGITLFGDKTFTSRPTVYGHINVRWAFIVAKVSLVALARYYLFELNNEFTRAQFVNAARPLLRSMRSRNAFEDFQLICNESNNDSDVRKQNRMVAELRIKPLYSINWIVLNLTPVDGTFVFTDAQ